MGSRLRGNDGVAYVFLRASHLDYTFSGLLATSSFTAFEVHGRQDPAGISLDDFSVIDAALALA